MKRVCKKPAAASDDMSDTSTDAPLANQPDEEKSPVTAQEVAGAESKVGADDPMQTYQDIFTYEHMQIKL